jgi:hypothetical protein
VVVIPLLAEGGALSSPDNQQDLPREAYEPLAVEEVDTDVEPVATAAGVTVTRVIDDLQ